jgi:BirA family biotin operon repressor/biotin-[acetyl-CoA-carboxylase] ligase
MGRRGVPAIVTDPDEQLMEHLTVALGPEGPIRHLEVHQVLTSTNAHALEDGREGLVVLALEQTEGRGRHGNAWSSPPGGLYLSYVPTRDIMPSRPTDLSLLASLAVVDVVESALERAGVSEPRALVKWPNDVLVSDGKVAGVLVQSRDPPMAVVGVGLNVNTDVTLDEDRSPEEWPVGPRSLAQVVGHPLEIAQIAVDLMEALVARVAAGLDGPPLEEYRSRCHTLGKRVAFTEAGVRTVGTAVDIDLEGGGLLVRVEGEQVRRVTSGEVRHVRSVKG